MARSDVLTETNRKADFFSSRAINHNSYIKAKYTFLNHKNATTAKLKKEEEKNGGKKKKKRRKRKEKTHEKTTTTKQAKNKNKSETQEQKHNTAFWRLRSDNVKPTCSEVQANTLEAVMCRSHLDSQMFPKCCL